MAATGYGQTADLSRVAKAGDTMTGPLVLTGNPAMQASAGAVLGDLWTSDSVGNGSWQPAGGGAGYLQAANNLSDLTSASAARLHLGLGSAALLSAGGVVQTANNLSDLASAGTSRSNLGLGTAAVQSIGSFLQPTNNLSDLTSASAARVNLGLGGAAIQNIGTSAGTVAAGNDSRIVGAIPVSTVTAKGDLIVGVSSSAVGRLAVGSDGQVLTADSSQTAGAKWSAVTTPLFRGTWSNGTTYSSGDTVVLNNRAYQAVQSNTGHGPLISTQLLTATPGTIDGGDSGPYEMGLKITPSQDLRLTGLAFYKATANTGTHVGRIWRLGANGTYYKINEATFTGETSSGWQTVALAADLASGDTYIVSCAFPSGHYSFDSHYFDSPVTVGSITAPVGAGMFAQPPGTVPNITSNNANYWVSPIWGEPNPTWWQEIGTWQLLSGFPSAQESAAAYVLSLIGANGGLAGLDGFGKLIPTEVPANVLLSSTSAAGDLSGVLSAPTVTSTHLSVPLSLSQGGTASSAAQTAMDTLAGGTTSGSYLRGNGSHVVLSAIQTADVPTLNQSTSGSAAVATAAAGLLSASTTVVVNNATAPSAGQALLATGSSAASWQTLSAVCPTVAAFSLSGALSVQTGDFRWYNDSGRTMSIGTVRASVGVPSSGASIICDVQVNNTTIYGTSANRPTIATSAYTAVGGTASTSVVTSGQFLTTSILQVGSSTAGSDLTLTVWLT